MEEEWSGLLGEQRGDGAWITGFTPQQPCGVVSGYTGEASSLGNASWHPPAAGTQAGAEGRIRRPQGAQAPAEAPQIRRAPGLWLLRTAGREGQRQRLAEPPADPHPRWPSVRPSVRPSIHSILSRCPGVGGAGGHLGYRVRDAGLSPGPGTHSQAEDSPLGLCRVSSRRLPGPFVFRGHPASQRRRPPPSERISACRARRLC